MAANQAWFPAGKPTTDVLLRSRGFDARGNRSGGLKIGSAVVTIPAGTTLLRLYRWPGELGDWWFTPHEYRRIQDYFAISGAGLVEGRAGGKSALHAMLLLLSEWYGDSPDQLAYFHVAILREPLLAMYGEGDVATNANYSLTLKPIAIDQIGGWARGARQLFLPDANQYRGAFDLQPQASNVTDIGLDRAVAGLGNQRLSFE